MSVGVGLLGDGGIGDKHHHAGNEKGTDGDGECEERGDTAAHVILLDVTCDCNSVNFVVFHKSPHLF